MKYNAAIDGLRAVAILIVVVSHYGAERFVPGGFGVTLFFFISGYLITGILIRESDGRGGISISKFYIRRFIRLAPALLIMIAVVSLVYASLIGPISLPQTTAALFYYTNYYMIVGGYSPEPIGVLWSLAVEEHYYLIFPLAFALAWQFRWSFIGAITAVAAAVLFWRIALVTIYHAPEIRTYYATDTRVDSILFGAFLACALHLKPVKVAEILSRSSILAISAALLLISFIYRYPSFRETGRYTLQGIALISLVYFFAIGPATTRVRTLLQTRLFNFLGKISYSLYLWHFAILYFCQKMFSQQWEVIVVGIPLSFALASASYFIVEKPMQRVRHKFKPSVQAAT